jgi:hypothetical protein
MIIFWIDRDQPDLPLLRRGAFELGCRMGGDFSVVTDLGEVPSQAAIIRYGAAAPDERRVALTIEAGANARPGPVVIDGFKLWSIGSDVLAGAADLITGRVDRDVPAAERDPFGCVLPHFHPLAQAGLLQEPLLENGADYLRRCLERAGVALGPKRNPWGPPGAFAVALTHDVDGPRLHSAFALARALIRGTLNRTRGERDALLLGVATLVARRPDPYWNFELWRRLERALHIRSTFYFYVAGTPGVRRHPRDPRYDIRAPRFRGVIDGLREEGCEIGIHHGIRGHGAKEYASTLAALGRLAPGPASVGSRAHYWATDWRAPERTWAGLSAAGYSHDASLSPLTVGFRFGAASPMSPVWNDGRPRPENFTLLSTAIMDQYLVEAPDQAELIERMVGNVRRVSGALVMDWHERVLCNRGPWAGYVHPLLALLDRLRAESDARFLTVEEIAAQWRTHIRHCFHPLDQSAVGIGR